MAGAQHEVHWGLAESRLYQTAQYAGDIQDPAQLVRFLEVFGASDYFRLAGGDKEQFYRDPPADFYELFFELMDSFAQRAGASHWVTKLDPMFLSRPTDLDVFIAALDTRYPISRFVGIRREFRSVLKSYLNMEGDRSIHELRGIRRGAAVALESGRYVSHNRGIEELLQRRLGLLVTFEALQSERERTLQQVAKHLDLTVDDMPQSDRYKPNSSHGTRQLKRPGSKHAQRLAENLLLPMFQHAPPLADALLHLRDRTRETRAPVYFRLLQLERMPAQLSKHLLKTGQTALWEQIFGAESDFTRNTLAQSRRVPTTDKLR